MAVTIVSCTKDAWTKVATNVTAALVEPFAVTFTNGLCTKFFRTNVATGGGAPTGTPSSANGAKLLGSDGYNFAAAAGSDIYIYAKDSAGSMRVSV